MSKKNGAQQYPSNVLKITIDNLSNKAFGARLASGEKTEDEVFESRKKKIISKITLTNGTGQDVQFTEFDRAVFDVCISEQAKGNELITPSIIFHQLGGGDKLTPNMRKAIMESIEKLAGVRGSIDMEECVDKKIIRTKDEKYVFRGYLLPTESIETTINGQNVTAIRFLSKGIIYGIADMKNQIINSQKNLLASPVRATPRTIAINHYLLRRSLEIKGSKDRSAKNKYLHPLRKIITLQDMCEKCGIPFDDRTARHDARGSATKILKFLVENKIIKNFHFEKKDGKIYSIVIDV